MLSVVVVCADYGGMNVFHVCLNICVVYGVGGLCQCMWCSLILTSGCCLLCCDVV